MFDLSPEKILVLAVLALLVLGPDRLPDAARSLGRLIGQLKSMSASMQSEVREALHDPNDAITSAIAEFRPGQVRRSVRRAVTDTLTSSPPGGPPAGPFVDTGGAVPSPSAASAARPGADPPSAASFPGPSYPWTPDDPALN